jgi:hypothetical protein
VIEDEIARRIHNEVLVCVLCARRRLVKTGNPSTCATVIGNFVNQR